MDIVTKDNGQVCIMYNGQDYIFPNHGCRYIQAGVDVVAGVPYIIISDSLGSDAERFLMHPLEGLSLI